MEAKKIELKAYEIGGNFFVEHPTTGRLHEVGTGREAADTEWKAYDEYIDLLVKAEREQEQIAYEQEMEDELQRHETTIEEIKKKYDR